MNNKQRRAEIWSVIASWLDESDPGEIIGDVGFNINQMSKEDSYEWIKAIDQIKEYCNGKVRECNG